jgi:hypothetical protein
MFNYAAIDKTPTVMQVKAIIEYMEKNPNEKYMFRGMMDMRRPEPNKVLLDLNDAHMGEVYEVIFEGDVIVSFENTGNWIS